jgi:phage/plasmid-like protein (TIGR03299 family)
VVGFVGGPVILGESHDLGDIGGTSEADIQRALRSLAGAGGWDAAEYGITAERAAAMVRAADTPANRARVVEELRRRAIRRAGLDVSTGRVAVMTAGEAARQALWHRLGVQVRDAVSSDQAITLASLNWTVEKVPTAYTWAGQAHEMGDVFALVRSDTGTHLCTVGSRYQVIQNAEAFRFMDAVLAEHGAQYKTAGAIYGVAKVWLQVSLPETSFTLAGNDRVEATALFTNPHDGSGVARCIPTSDRAVSANTLRVAVGKAERGLSVRHTGSIRGKLDDARRALGIAVKGFEQFREQAEVLRATRVPDQRAYVHGVLDEVLEITQAKAKLGAERLADADLLAGIIEGQEARDRLVKSYARKIEERGNVLDDILNRYEQEWTGLGGARGTAWAALNAVEGWGGRRSCPSGGTMSRHLDIFGRAHQRPGAARPPSWTGDLFEGAAWLWAAEAWVRENGLAVVGWTFARWVKAGGRWQAVAWDERLGAWDIRPEGG